jgi:hypothetical protein
MRRRACARVCFAAVAVRERGGLARGARDEICAGGAALRAERRGARSAERSRDGSGARSGGRRRKARRLAAAEQARGRGAAARAAEERALPERHRMRAARTRRECLVDRIVERGGVVRGAPRGRGWRVGVRGEARVRAVRRRALAPAPGVLLHHICLFRRFVVLAARVYRAHFVRLALARSLARGAAVRGRGAAAAARVALAPRFALAPHVALIAELVLHRLRKVAVRRRR